MTKPVAPVSRPPCLSDADRAAAHALADHLKAVRESVFAEIVAERLRQCDLGYDLCHDRRHAAETWLLLAIQQLADLMRQGGGLDHDRYREQAVRAMALLMASLEAAEPLPEPPSEGTVIDHRVTGSGA